MFDNSAASHPFPAFNIGNSKVISANNTTTMAGDLVVNMVRMNGGETFTAGGGWTISNQINGAPSAAIEYATVATAGNVRTGFNASGSNPWEMLGFAMEPLGAFPLPPVDLGIVASTSSSLTITWLDQTLPQYLYNTTIWTATGCVSASWTGHTIGAVQVWQDTGLAATQTVAFSVQVANSSAGSGWSECVQGTTLSAVPSAPTALHLVVARSQNATLAWTLPPGSVTAETLEWGISPTATTWTRTYMGPANSQVLTGLNASTTYVAGVAAWNATGESGFSSTVSFTTASYGALPAAPTGLATIAGNQTTEAVTWTNPAGALTLDSVMYGTACGTTSWTWVRTVNAPTNTVTLVSLVANTHYCLTAAAWTAAGEGPVAHPFLNFTTASNPAAGTVPAAPTALATIGGNQTVEAVTWTNPMGAVTWDEVEYGTSCGTTTWSYQLTVPGPTNLLRLAGLAQGASYCLTALAANATGWSAVAHPFLNFTTAAGPAAGSPPAAPTGLYVLATSPTSATLAWTPPPGAVTAVTVSWGRTCPTVNLSETWLGPANAETILGLDPSTGYCARAYAWNSTGEGPASADLTLTTPSFSTAIRLTAAPINTTAVRVSWSPAGGAVANYTLMYARFYGLPIAYVSVGNHTTYNLTNLGSGITYYLTVWSWNSTGQGPPSNVAVAQTNPVPPTVPPFPWATLEAVTTLSILGTMAVSFAIAAFVSGRRSRRAEGAAAVALSRTRPREGEINRPASGGRAGQYSSGYVRRR